MRVALALIIAAGLLACGRGPDTTVPSRMVAPVLTGAEAHDVHSRAEPQVARVTHVDLDLTADFGAQALAGTATLHVLAKADNPVLTLDTHGLVIESVVDADQAKLAWDLGAIDPELGAPLSIPLGKARRVVIRYRTGPDAPALQWLQPAQTAGGRHPYLFSQGQAILTRTWIPTQDSPGVRQTWTARIVAPRDLTVVMSAAARGDEPAGDGQRAWHFAMEQPVAPYLIAMAVGDIAYRAIGPRTGVYTEPAMLDSAAAEFADLEQMLQTAEALYGEYQWGRYDVLVLPPSFPFGGMENPRLTFATPTIIAGDRSLVSLIAHEIAHSWSGNLVSNATWSDFWLNEGFTNYIEYRIMEAVFGERSAAMLAALGWDSLQAELKKLGGATGADTRLHIDLAGRSPDDGLTDIPYEKGATFLRTIESYVGRERFDAWLKGYFGRHAFSPQTSSGFLADVREHLLNGDADLEQRIGLEDWVYGTGMPRNAVRIEAAAFAAVDAAAQAFAADGSLPQAEQWSSAERVRFLDKLPRRLSASRLAAVMKHLQLDSQRNSEVRFAWLMLAIGNRFGPALPQVEEFLLAQGRRKFVQPLFKALMEQGDWGAPHARRIYARARPGYHSVTTGSVDEIVPLPPPGTVR